MKSVTATILFLVELVVVEVVAARASLLFTGITHLLHRNMYVNWEREIIQGIGYTILLAVILLVISGAPMFKKRTGE